LVLARHEPEHSDRDGPLSLRELLALLGEAKVDAERDRQEADRLLLVGQRRLE
jgi:hypothetical protein